jgi:pyruvate/2-oxoglutarate dehydrogenase complex dihydrolipoamide dehydrogenase (E3) component
MSDLADEYDVIVIGTGPGGEGAAMQAVKHNKSVVVNSEQGAEVCDLSIDSGEQQRLVP